MSLASPSPEDRASTQASAKLNLYLHMIGRRANGFHELESLVAFTQAGDALTAERAETLTLRLEGPFAATLRETPDDDNLVLKAARGLADWARGQSLSVPGAALTLTKTLPVASGIGGGSADAAAALLVLKRLWGLPIGDEALSALAERLGADVPACLAGRAALMAGIGEQLSAVPALPAVPVLLVNPGVPLPTPAVYRAFREGYDIKPLPRPKPVGPFADARALVAALAVTDNDLEAPAVAICPAIGDVLSALGREGALMARMSGSGATCFGLYPDAASAAGAARRLKAAKPGWWIIATELRRTA